jgi:hypothetical protein
VGFVPRRLDDFLDARTDAEAEPEAPTKRRLVTRTKRPDGDPAKPAAAKHAKPPTTGTGGAARGLLAAARAATPVVPPNTRFALKTDLDTTTPQAPVEPAYEPALPGAHEPLDHPEELAAELAADTPDTDEPVHAAPPTEMPAIYRFAPLKSARRFLSLVLLTGLVASGYLGYLAYQSRDEIQIGIAATVTFATLVIWAIRAGATVTLLTVRRGQLEISRQGGRMVFDLASTYTPIQVIGRPGSKKWKVLFQRRGMTPVVVDSSMVDPQDFMRVLRFFRPDL